MFSWIMNGGNLQVVRNAWMVAHFHLSMPFLPAIPRGQILDLTHKTIRLWPDLCLNSNHLLRENSWKNWAFCLDFNREKTSELALNYNQSELRTLDVETHGRKTILPNWTCLLEDWVFLLVWCLTFLVHKWVLKCRLYSDPTDLNVVQSELGLFGSFLGCRVSRV